jgi:hypothetical protein
MLQLAYFNCARYTVPARRLDEFFLCKQWIDSNRDGAGEWDEFRGIRNDFSLEKDEAVIFVSSWTEEVGLPWTLELVNPSGETVYLRTRTVARPSQYSLNRLVFWRFATYQEWRELSGQPLSLDESGDNFFDILDGILKKDVAEGKITQEEGEEFFALCIHDTTTNEGIYAEAEERIPDAHFTEAIRPLLERDEAWTNAELCELICGSWTVRWYLHDDPVEELTFSIN